MQNVVAKIAVQAATYWIDKPYDYLVPEELRDRICPGMRVSVPFSGGNRTTEGIVLSVTDHSEYDRLKSVLRVLDDEPVITEAQLRLAAFMKDRFFCTIYDCVHSMLPAGMWFRDDGKRKVSDKYTEMARLNVPVDEAEAALETRRKRAKQQAALLELLITYEALPVSELLTFTGAGRQSLNALAKDELISFYRRETFRRPQIPAGEQEPLPVLNQEQKDAFDGINRLASSGEAHAALLFGVTGSGKTSVYIHLISERLREGRTAMLLVPEIALTPQMIRTFAGHFGDQIAVLHSSLSNGERYDEWKRIRAGKARLVIGTRSAVFAPLENLGLIIIDEEQEETYKSENAPRYHARDIAKYLCVKANCTLLLGSATPEVTSFYYAQSGRYSFFRLNTRYNEMELPGVMIADMRQELKGGNSGNISGVLQNEIQKNLDNGEQSILFINRRGTNKLISCGECGYIYQCPRCSASLTYHGSNGRLICHYCGYSRKPDRVCPDCGGVLRYVGAGTQLVVEELNRLFPGTEVLRMDSDSVAPVGSHEELFERFRNERIPIMVGTQMVTKGLNFENVTLVGVISADQSLYSGEYKAGERTFSLITQVVGRSGRGRKPGRAVIQTFTPDNETILQASRQDYESFYYSEIEMRRLQNTPPFTDIYSITATGEDEGKVIRCCREMSIFLTDLLRQTEARILGPVPLVVVKVNNRFRYRVNVYCPTSAKLRKTIAETVIRFSTDKRFSGVSVFADADPLY